jgi:hypothetical protein
VKGQRIRWAALLPDDRIAFGSQKYRVYLGPDDAPAPSERPRKRQANGIVPKPVAFAAPSPLGTPVVKPAPEPVQAGTDSDDWRLAMKPAGASNASAIPVQLNDHELLIEDDDIVEVEDDDIIELP